MPAQRENPASLNAFYALYFMTTGITLPFLPPYLQTLGLSASQVGLLLSVGPLAALLLPPLWGQWADRTGRPGQVLLTLILGATAGLGVLLAAQGFLSALVGMVVMHTFICAVTPVADTIALNQVQTQGGSYARIRSFGSAGFVVSTLIFGFAVTDIDRAIITVPLTLMALTALWVFIAIRGRAGVAHESPRATRRDGLALLQQPAIRWLLLATALHWVAAAPYHAALGLHFRALGFSPLTLSVASCIAVGSEVLVLASSPRWVHRFSEKTLLLVAFGVSVVRWAAMGLTDDPWALGALAALHGISFGAFYMAAVNAMTALAPGHLRATGQSLFAAITFGLGGLIGYPASGALFDAQGGHVMFGAAALVEAVALGVMLRWRAPAVTAAAKAS